MLYNLLAFINANMVKLFSDNVLRAKRSALRIMTGRAFDRPPGRVTRAASGFILVELIVALTLLGITITGLLFGVSTGISSEKVVEDINIASSLARSQLEHTLAQPYVEPPIYPTITAPAGYNISFSNIVVEPLLLAKISVTVSNPEKALVTLDTYKANTSYVAGPPALVLSQRDFRWFENVNDRNPISALAAENTSTTAAAPNQVYRLRLNLSVSGLSMPVTSQSFKLQYSSNTGGPWNDLGAIGSGLIWRGYDNSIPADGVTVTSLVLSNSSVMESYEEQNPSGANPNALSVGQFGEWDWVIQENNAIPNTTYYFRMVKSDGTALDSYTQLVPLTTAPPIVYTQKDYRWYANLDSATPVTSLAAENSAVTGVVPNTVLRIRLNAEIGGANLGAGSQSFKLQYSVNLAGPWTDVGAIGSGSIWRGSNNSSPSDGATLPGLLLSTSHAMGTYEEQNPSSLNPNAINVGQRGEWDWVVQNNGAAGGATYYFRMVKADGNAMDSYTNYPQLTTASLSLTQQDYRLYSNSNTINPIFALAAENTPYYSPSHGQVYRIRMNVGASGAYLFSGSQAFKLQYATTTLGPWTDLGAAGSGTIWRGYNNPGPTDGSTITSLLLSTSNVAESYEEQNPSVLNPNSLLLNQRGEWDWVIEDNNSTASTPFYFRMVRSDGSVLDGYVNYPRINIPPALALTQQDYRWYTNANAVNPVTPLAVENTAYPNATLDTVFRLRINIQAIGIDLATSAQAFKLQYSTSTLGPWTDLGAIGSLQPWRGFDNPTPPNGGTVTAALLSSSTVTESYDEQNPSVVNPVAIPSNGRGEWDWVVQDNITTGNITYYFRMVKSDGTSLDSYVNYPQLTTAPQSIIQKDYRIYTNLNSLTPTTSLATQNSPVSASSHNQTYRIRMNIEVGGIQLTAGALLFKLQYATSTGGPWNDLGAVGSGAVWRGFDNAGAADGATLPSLLLSGSNVLETYEEQSPSATNPNAINVGQSGEYDWVVQDNGAQDSASYFFRLVKGDDTALDSYVNYPQITIPSALVLTQEDYRWWQNRNNQTPNTSLAAENTAITSITLNTVLRIRMNVSAAGANLPAASQDFKLQYATATGGPWGDVGGLGSLTAWRGFDNGTPVDGDLIASLLLLSSTVTGSYEEQNPSVTNPGAINAGQRAEWDWVIQNFSADANTIYYFRMAKSDGTSLSAHTNYPQLTTSPLTVTQRRYRWYTNINSLTPTTPLALENTATTSATHNIVYRIRMNLEVGGTTLSAGMMSFKLQYATGTGGPWSDVGLMGSATAAWRGYNNASPSDGGTVAAGLLLSDSDVRESYEEENPSVTNPNSIGAGLRGEWDWVVQDNNAPDSTTFYFRVVTVDGSPLDSYVVYPQITTPPSLVITQQDYRWYANANSVTPTPALAAQNVAITGANIGTVYRIRMNAGITGANLPAAVQAFKLQYAANTGGPWTDVGTLGSASIWRGFNNTTPSDGAPITSLLLSGSNVLESYEEANPSVSNPNAVNVGQRGEWDWVVQNNGADGNTTYYFRLVKSDGTALDTYTNYPQLTTAPITLTQQDYRWYGNTNALNPTTALEAENVATIGASMLTTFRLRMNMGVTDSNLSANLLTFKLQYATSTGGPWFDIGAIGSTAAWRGLDNATPADGASVTSLLLSTSGVAGTYEEQNASALNPNAITAGQRGEWDWVVQDYKAASNTTYFFRMVKGDGTDLDSYVNYPQITTALLTLTQQDYRWYANTNAISPATSISAENTATTAVAHNQVFRLRMNLEAGGSTLPATAQSINLQFATSTGGPWTDAGGIGSGVIWRGFNNATPADGAALVSLLLSTSNVLETYEEQNPSANNPNAFNAGQRGEWDWVLEDNGASANTTYFFRLVKDDGAELDGYVSYPEITMPAPLFFNQQDYRWYANANAIQPVTPLAAEDTVFNGAIPSTVYRIRMNLEVSGSNIPALLQDFKLQFSTDTGGPWTDVGAIGSGAIWRGFDNAAPADGATVSSVLLSTSTVAESYEEQNNSALNPSAINQGQRGEWDWVVQNNSAERNTSYYFRMVKSSGSGLDLYTNYPAVITSPILHTQQDYRWYANTNAVTPVTALAAQNTVFAADTHKLVYRLRMNVEIGGSNLPSAFLAFKLQYATTTLGPWLDVGAIGSGIIWEGYDNATPVDGATLPSLLLTGSNVLETYEEQNPSSANPNGINIGQRGEWDWVVRDNGAPDSSTFYFRMAKDDGTALETYNNYPQFTAAPPLTFTQQDYRWWQNRNNNTPNTALAAENTAITSITAGTVLRIRMNLTAGGANLAAGMESFKLQYATSVFGAWTDVGALGSTDIWRGFNNGTPPDGQTLPSVLLTTSDVAESYEEQNPSANNPNGFNIGQRGEWDWVVENNGAEGNTVYYFRMVKSDGTVLASYVNFPQLTTNPFTVTQEDYRWYENRDNPTPITALAAENTATTASSHNLVYRIRMNLQPDLSSMAAGAIAFKLQYNTSTTAGVWSDVGAIGSTVAWRGFDNPAAPNDGDTLPSFILSTSNQRESYEESNPSVDNPRVITVGQRGEWDWVIQDNNAADSTTYYFRMVQAGGVPLDVYVNYPALTTAPPLVMTQQDYRWYTNINDTDPVTPLAGQNVAYSNASLQQVLRLRMSISPGGAGIAAGTRAFKLQYSTSTGGPWTDVGAIGSTAAWGGSNNGGPADGDPITTLLLSTSNVMESYEEENPSVSTLNAINIGQNGEWDWVAQNYGAAAGATYYFRMVRDDGAALNSYTNYPRIDTAPLTFAQQDYRWYSNINSLNPVAAFAAQDTPYTSSTHGILYRLRMNLAVGGSNLPAAYQAFKLQYSTGTGGPWNDVGAAGSGVIWRGFDNTTPADGANITTLLLTTSNVLESYEEQNPSAANPNAINNGQRGEWDWVVEDNNAASNTAYYFRMVKSDGTVLDSYVNYPQLTMPPALIFTQQDYRWYANANAINPTTAIGPENTATTADAYTQQFRLRMNVAVGGANLTAGRESFKLQYALSILGPWTDLGLIGYPTEWRGYDNLTPADDSAITALRLSSSNVLGSYEEENPSALNPYMINNGQRGEWDWVIENNSAAAVTAYYFRIVKADGTPLDSYVNYPQLTTPLPTIAQDDFESGGISGGTGWNGDWTLVGLADIVTQQFPYQGSYHLRLRSNTGDARRSLDLSGKTAVRAQFWAKISGLEVVDTAIFSVSPDGTNWTTVKTWVNGEDDNVYHFWDFDLSSYSMTANFWLRFQSNNSNPSERFTIDWLKVLGQ